MRLSSQLYFDRRGGLRVKRSYTQESTRWISGAGCLTLMVLVCVSTGCAPEPLPTVDIQGAEFSDADDYAQYDRELIEAAKGQAP